MNAVRKELEELAGKELEAANSRFAPFASTAEAYGVLLEEQEETEEACEEMRKQLRAFWQAVRQKQELTGQVFEDLFCKAINTAAEAVQVAAMAMKAQALLKPQAACEPKEETQEKAPRRGLLLYRCPVCGSVFYRADRVSLDGMVVSCNCGAVKTIDAGQLAPFAYKCGSCERTVSGWTNAFEAEITTPCKCKNLITLRWNKKAKRYTEGGL